jgi:hypothetical protein
MNYNVTMFNHLKDLFKHSKVFQLTFFIFILLSAWWTTIYIRGLKDNIENDVFTIVLPIFALIGGITGWNYAQKWGGLKSILGRTIIMFTIGLLAQLLGYVLYNSYIYFLGIEIPYPSFGDVLFLGSVILYIYGAYLLGKVAGIKFTFNNVKSRLLAILIPALVLLLSYYVFLNGYVPDWSNLIVIFLDFGYPIAQAIYVSLALLALLSSRYILGGIMSKPILLLIFALIVQYIADFSFSYQVSRETWYVGGTNDYLYMFANFLMVVAILSIGNMFYKVRET